MKKIFLNGCFGACNLGDDLMMNITINDIKKIINSERFKIYVKNKGNKRCLNLKDEFVCNLFGVSKIEELKLIARSDYYIWGGGTFLYEGRDNGVKSLLSIWLHIFIAKMFRTKVILYGIGFGPFRTFLGKFIGCSCIKLSNNITVRDNLSFNQIEKINSNVYLTNDLVYRQDMTNVDLIDFNDDKRHIIINTVYHQDIESLEKFSALIINKLKKLQIDYSDVYFHLVSAWESELDTDLVSNKIVLSNLSKYYKFNYSIHENQCANEMISLINSMDIVFAQRLHVLLISSLLNKKIYTFQYHSKIGKFLNSINYEDGEYDINMVKERIKESEMNFIYLKKIIEN